jgi:ATP-binding cassette subfamily B protein
MTDPSHEYTAIDPYHVMPAEEETPPSRHTWRTKGGWEQFKLLPHALPYLRPYRKLYVLTILFTLMGSVIALAEPWPLAVLVDSVLGNHAPTSFLKAIFGADPNPYTLLVFVVIAGFGITIIGHGITVLNDYVGTKLEQNMILDLRSKLFDHCQGLSLTFHDERYTGQLMTMINAQAAAVGAVVMTFPPLAQNLLTLIGMLIIALLIDWQVTLVSLVAVPFIYYSLGLYGTRILPRVRQVMRLEWGSLSIVYEAMSMLRVIVSFGREKYEHRRFRTQGQTAVDARVQLTVRETLFALGVTAATAGGTALVLGFGATHVLNGQIRTGELLVLISYIAAVYKPLETISTSLAQLNQQLVYLRAALSLLDKEPEVTEDADAIDLGRARGEITFADVSFAYKDRDSTLENVSFQINAGQRIAIVGPTGAGKTTLANLIVRFYDPKDGRILVDGTDIRRLKLKCLREQISLVMQEPMLFSGTIAENIRYGRLDATMDEVVEAAKCANAHDFISELPKGYETELGEGGHQLSGGERQRVCVARAFVKNAPILILDEPTSSIDSKTESVILDALDELMVGRTSIMIAHRLSTVRDADLILVMNQGEVVEQGTHEELVALNGLYRQLHDAQTRRRAMARPPDEVVHADRLVEAAITHDGHESVSPETEPARAGTASIAGNGRPRISVDGEDRQQQEAGATAKNGRPPAAGDGKDRQPQEAGAKADNRQFRSIILKPPLEREDIVCDVCRRTLLKGEIAEPFLGPLGSRWQVNGKNGDAGDLTFSPSRSVGREQERRLVCELCLPTAEQAGWTPLPSAGARA